MREDPGSTLGFQNKGFLSFRMPWCWHRALISKRLCPQSPEPPALKQATNGHHRMDCRHSLIPAVTQFKDIARYGLQSTFTQSILFNLHNYLWGSCHNNPHFGEVEEKAEPLEKERSHMVLRAEMDVSGSTSLLWGFQLSNLTYPSSLICLHTQLTNI